MKERITKIYRKIYNRFYYWEPVYKFSHWYYSHSRRNSIDAKCNDTKD